MGSAASMRVLLTIHALLSYPNLVQGLCPCSRIPLIRSNEAIRSSIRMSSIRMTMGSRVSSTRQHDDSRGGVISSCRRNRWTVSLQAEPISTTEQKPGVIPAAVCVGVLTAAIGFLYGQVLDKARAFVWRTLPALFVTTSPSASSLAFLKPSQYIPLVLTSGGLLTALFMAWFPPLFTVGNFVSALSSSSSAVDDDGDNNNDPSKTIPRSSSKLLPLLFVSLLTSVVGFSLGPEAPMVAAGGLVGATLQRRFWPHLPRSGLAYAGAAGALTAFMGIPIAGSVFALEMTRSTVRAAGGAGVVEPAVAASVAGIVLLRTVLLSGASMGGHFVYPATAILTESGRRVMLTAGIAGVCGAGIGTAFQLAVGKLKNVLWQPWWPTKNGRQLRQSVVLATLGGLLVGLLSVPFPQTLFWGEGSMQCLIDGQQTPLSMTHHGLTGGAVVDPSTPFQGWQAPVQLAAVKLASIVLASIAKLPGGIIFPLFAAAAPLGHLFPSGLTGVAVMCLMASTQASVTRTPLATALILALSASSSVSVLFPACLVASYTGVWVARLLSKRSYFEYSNVVK